VERIGEVEILRIIKTVATVKCSRTISTDDFWGEIVSEIELAAHIPAEAFDGIYGHCSNLFSPLTSKTPLVIPAVSIM